MRRTLLALLLAMTAAALLAAGGRARAQDDSVDTRIEIRGPLEAAACDGTPRTIRVLGLSIDVTGARFDSGEDAAGPEEDKSAGCEGLAEGGPVTVRLGGDGAPLSAAEVVPGGDEQDIAIRAPIQAVSGDLQTITLLGLPIDASTVRFTTSDGEDVDLNDPDLDPARRLLGRLVQADLDPGSLPSLVASGVELIALPGEDEGETAGAEEGTPDAEEGEVAPAEPVTVIEVEEVFFPGLIDNVPPRSPRPHAPRLHAPPRGRMMPHSRPPSTIRGPAIRMRAAPGVE